MTEYAMKLKRVGFLQLAMVVYRKSYGKDMPLRAEDFGQDLIDYLVREIQAGTLGQDSLAKIRVRIIALKTDETRVKVIPYTESLLPSSGSCASS